MAFFKENKEQLPTTNRWALQFSDPQRMETLRGITATAAALVPCTPSNFIEQRLAEMFFKTPEAEYYARSIFVYGDDVLTNLERIAQTYSAGANWHARYQNGKAYIDFTYDFLLRRNIHIDQSNEHDVSFLNKHLGWLVEMAQDWEKQNEYEQKFPGAAPYGIWDEERDGQYSTSMLWSLTQYGPQYQLCLEDGYPAYPAFNIAGYIRDGWMVWGDHTYAYRALAAMLRACIYYRPGTEQDTAYDVWSFVQMVNEISSEWPKDETEPYRPEAAMTLPDLIGGENDA